MLEKSTDQNFNFQSGDGRMENEKLVETNFSNLLLNFPSAVGVLSGPEHVLVFANKMYLQLAGNKDVIGKSVRETFPEFVEQGFIKLLDAVYATGEPFIGNEILFRVDKEDGTQEELFFNIVYQPWYNNEGIVKGILVHGVDVTRYILTRKKIEESEIQFRTLSDNISQFAWMADENGWIYWYNKRWYDYTGTTLEEMQGWGWQKVHHPDHVNRVIGKIKHSWDTGELWEDTFPLRSKNGEYRWFLSRALPIRNADGKIVRWFGTNTDVTEQRESIKRVEESEAKYRSLFNSMDQGYCIVEIIFDNHNKAFDYSFLEVNPMFERHTGLKNAIGKTARELLPGLEEKWYDIYGNVALTGRPKRFIEVSEVMQRYFEVYAFRIGEEGSRKVAILFSDITEQVENRKKIEESEVRFRNLAQTLPQLVWVTDGQGNAEFASIRWKEYSGIEPGGEEEWRAIVHPDDYDNINAAWVHSLTTGVIYTFDVRLKSKTGEYRWHTVKGEPVLDNENKIVKWVGAFIDIQDQKVREEKKDEFISIASHEMKTPLTTLKAYLQMLEISLDEKNKEAMVFAKKASQSVNRLSELISELLDVSKIRLGKLNYTISTFNFNDMVDNTIENIQLTSPTHIILKSGTVLDKVTGDRDRLQQVLINLLTNAIKYSPRMEKIYVAVEQENDKVKVSVKDSGIGIGKESLTRIFDKYHRIEEHSLHFQGLGIGLFISYEIIQRHHGRLWAESEPGKGSVFYFTLPVNYMEPA